MNTLFKRILYCGKKIKSNSFVQKILNAPVLVLLIVLCLFLGSFFFGNAQGKSILPGSSHGGDTISSNQPKIDIHVNKKYDEQGNIIGYDSTYSYTSNDSSGSGMENYRSFSYRESDMMNDKEFKKLFSDSMMMPGDPFKGDFFNDDFFRNNLDFPSSSMQDIKHYFDSITNQLSPKVEKPVQPQQPVQPKKPAAKSKQKSKPKQNQVLRNYNIY